MKGRDRRQSQSELQIPRVWCCQFPRRYTLYKQEDLDTISFESKLDRGSEVLEKTFTDELHRRLAVYDGPSASTATSIATSVHRKTL